MALEADGIACRISPQLLGPERTMRIVAIVALNETFIDPVMKGTSELGAHVHMARIAKLRGFHFHQKLGFLGMVWRVAVDTGHAIGQVRRTVVVSVFIRVLMATQAACAGLLRSSILEGEDLGLVASTIHVLFTGAMTGFAAMPLGALLNIKSSYEVRRGFVILEEVFRGHVFVAGFADLCADIGRLIRGAAVFLSISCGLGIIFLRFRSR